MDENRHIDCIKRRAPSSDTERAYQRISKRGTLFDMGVVARLLGMSEKTKPFRLFEICVEYVLNGTIKSHDVHCVRT